MTTRIFTLDDFDYSLPTELIAQFPASRRDESRLMVLRRSGGDCEHRQFKDIGDYLREGDVLAFNDTRVISARLHFFRSTGARIEVILLRRVRGNEWEAISNRTKRLAIGETIVSTRDDAVTARIMGKGAGAIRLETNIDFTDDVLARIGSIPLPPYMNREAGSVDEERYQTVYAVKSGAVAAPTAGLHFTDDLIGALTKKGVLFAPLTLYVSWGTFQPVREQALDRHVMHRERYDLPRETADIIRLARQQTRRIIAIGTTTLRVLESTLKDGELIPGTGETDLFIHPPMPVRSVDGLITNFHTPRSTLLMLVAAFAGYDRIMKAYRDAVERRYRFFSYGDAMFII